MGVGVGVGVGALLFFSFFSFFICFVVVAFFKVCCRFDVFY